ncbi:MAG TPA: 5'-nucleotidase C-terminal domain-containing protein [Myxococcales bacterium]
MRLTVLHTSDIHSRFLPYDLAPLKTDADLGLAPEAPPYGGSARLAALIKRERARADRSLLVDSGDYWQGGPIFNSSDGEPEMKWMSLMNYDGVVMGNHEFDKGVMNFSDKYTRFGHYPLLAANYWWENRNQANSTNFDKMSAPYTLANVRGLRVAMLGMASIGSMYGLVDGGNSTQATPLEQNECARAYVEMLKPTTDLIMVVSHLGLTEDQDLVTGYDAYYPYESALPFMSRATTDLTRWQQIEPPLSQCEAAGTPREKCTFLDGTVRVFIPGVSGIDVIEGGHLHIVLNPPQVLRDPTGRPVILSHSGAFAKYLGRLELEVQLPPAKPDVDESSDEYRNWMLRKAEGAEVVAHDYHAFPVDGIWCDDEARSWRANTQFEQFKSLITTRPTVGENNPDARPCRDRFWDEMKNANASNEFAVDCIEKYDRDFRGYECDRYLPTDCMARAERCSRQEDRPTTALLSPYITTLDQTFALTRIFAYAPREIARRNSSSGGDSPLGNMTAESMRIRQRVQAEISLTNTLGVRDNIYPGPVSLEAMFNVFPFENTINIMYVSGAEVQELADYVGQRSGERGCQAQAQISGMNFVMDCAQHQVNVNRYPCETAADCAQYGHVQHPAGWQCTEEKVCWAHTAYGYDPNALEEKDKYGPPRIGDHFVEVGATYKIAVNDYIAKGGSGFKVLKRNTTRIETNISLRDSLIDYLRAQCTCQDILGESEWNKGKKDVEKVSVSGYKCARAHEGANLIIDPIAVSWCKQALTFEDQYARWSGGSPAAPLPGLDEGACSCSQVLTTTAAACSTVNAEVLNQACNTPLVGGACSCADVLTRDSSKCGAITEAMRKACSTPLAGEGSCSCAQAVCAREDTETDPNPLKAYCSLSIGKCTCASVVMGDEKACGHIPRDLKNFCSAPTRVSIAVGEEDGRIGRRVK